MNGRKRKSPSKRRCLLASWCLREYIRETWDSLDDSRKVVRVDKGKVRWAYSWSIHVSVVIKKCNSLSYTLRHLSNLLTRTQHKKIIDAHFYSVLFYGSPIRAGCLSFKDTRGLNSLLYKIISRDVSHILSNRELCQQRSFRSFNSVRIIRDMNTLHNFITNPELTLRLIQQSVSFSRDQGRVSFFDGSRKRIGKNSFINRTKRIAELIPFLWADLSASTFKRMANMYVPLCIP